MSMYTWEAREILFKKLWNNYHCPRAFSFTGDFDMDLLKKNTRNFCQYFKSEPKQSVQTQTTPLKNKRAPKSSLNVTKSDQSTQTHQGGVSEIGVQFDEARLQYEIIFDKFTTNEYKDCKREDLEWLYRLDPDFISDDDDDHQDDDDQNHLKIFQFKITLFAPNHEEIEPPIWRRLQVPNNYTFMQFHLAIQRAMGWGHNDRNRTYHLHQFKIINPRTGFWNLIGPHMSGDCDETSVMPKDEESVKIDKYFVHKQSIRGLYLYDLAYGWEHEITLEEEKPLDDQCYPKCMGGERACPPEDVGSLGGSYGDFVDVISDPGHEKYDEFTWWLGGTFDPEFFDPKGCFES